MSFHDPRAIRPLGFHVGAPAETLFFSVFRCWMAGYATSDVACWDIAWEALRQEMPAENAKPLFGEFQHFVRALRETGGSEMGWRPAACRGLCHDECLLLTMIDAAQRDDRTRLAAVAARLLKADDLEPAIAATISLAKAFARLGLFITPVEPGAIAAIMLRHDGEATRRSE